jgi:hypothetical protein
MAENKTKATKQSVAEYIEAIADATRRTDAKTLVKVMRRVTGEKPVMWGPAIVGFGSYHYVYDSGREGDMPLTCFSPRKAATVVYIHAGLAASKGLLDKLGKHTISGGCLHIKNLADVDEKVLENVIVKSVAATRAKYPAR